MIALLASVWVASVVGGLHCAGMCGGFVCAITEPGRAFRSQAAWHAGRGLAYVGLGLAAGLLGRGIEAVLATAGIAHAAALGAGALLVARGAGELVGSARARPPRPAPWAGAVGRGLRAVRGLPPVPRALLVGSLTALLPCGWLWAFAATAAGTGQPLTGALVMLVFWSGTLPALAGVGVAAGGLAARFRGHVPRLAAVAMIVVGLLTVAGRFRPHTHAAGTHAHAAATPAHVPEEHAHGGH
jgi:sulfite exporter TauE/SafE